MRPCSGTDLGSRDLDRVAPLGRSRYRSWVKPDDIDAILDRHRDRFRRLVREIFDEETAVDPFEVPLDEFLAKPEPERAALAMEAARRADARVERELRERAASWIVIVGDDVVLSSRDQDSLPDFAQLVAIGRQRGRAPFLFEAPLIEELPSVSAWAPVTTGIRGDAYPTIPLRIDGVVLCADLDTGAHGTMLDGALSPAALDPPVWHLGTHLGQRFAWAPGAADVEIRLADGATRTARLPIRWVRDWARSPFVRIQPERRALAGRDLLRAFGVEVHLRPREPATAIG